MSAGVAEEAASELSTESRGFWQCAPRAVAKTRKKQQCKGKQMATAVSSPAAEPPGGGPEKALSTRDILQVATCFKGYTLPDTKPKVVVKRGIYNLEDATGYGIQSSLQEEMWAGEIDRLQAAVENVEEQLVFRGSSELLEGETAESYAYFANVADVLLISLNVCIHDSQGMLQKHCPDLVMDCLLQKTRSVLARYVGEDDDGDVEDDAAGGEGGDDGEQKPSIVYADCFELVNYMTATMARMLFRSATGTDWHNHTLAYLAKLSTKLKIVAHKPKEAVAASLEAYKDAKKPVHMSGLRAEAERTGATAAARNHGQDAAVMDAEGEGMMAGGAREELDKMVSFMSLLGLGQKRDSSGPKTLHVLAQHSYWLSSSMIQVPVLTIAQHVLQELRGQSALKTSLTTSFEMCTMLYDRGLEEMPSCLFQDMNGEYLGQCTPEALSVMNAALEAANMAIVSLGQAEEATRPAEAAGRGRKQSSSQRGSSGSGPSTAAAATAPIAVDAQVGAFVSYYYYNNAALAGSDWGGVKPKRKTLSSINAFATVTIPLMLTSPWVVRMTTDMIGVCVHASNTPNQIQLSPVSKVSACFCLSTTEYKERWAESGRTTVAPLSQSPLARDALLAWHSDGRAPARIPTALIPAADVMERGGGLLPLSVGPATAREPGEAERELTRQGLERLRQASKVMDGWVAEEGGVRVRCGWYVGSVMAMSAVLVAGGIAAGTTMGTRLAGVDPFGIATFCWVLATFLFLIAKSIRVNEWPWHDFMRFQVLCRSVTELSYVTGIDRQLILAKLLLDEPNTTLQTRGPYNCVFDRRINTSDGFSIDEPLSLRTMLLSGLIMVQVRAPYHGEFLVCLELRRGTPYSVVLQSNLPGSKEGEFIVSGILADSHNKATGNSEDKPPRIQLRRSKDVTWTSISGIYTDNKSSFV